MNMTEGNTLDTVRWLRRLLKEASPSELPDDNDSVLIRVSINALPALLDVAERVAKLEQVAKAARRLQITAVPLAFEDDDGSPSEVMVVDPTTYEEFREALREFDKAGPS